MHYTMFARLHCLGSIFDMFTWDVGSREYISETSLTDNIFWSFEP